MSGAPRSVQDLKTTFERRKAPVSKHTQQQTRAPPSDLANMSTSPQKPAASSKTPRNSIDAVLDTIPAKAASTLSVLGSTFAKRPSWIGPKPAERIFTPGGTIMKIPVTVEYESPDLQPPVFISTSLTDPQWNPIEMESTMKDDGQHHFKITFQAEEGEYQYKLRLGPGDWWVCDSTKPTVDDGAGNQNNLLVVKVDTRSAIQPAGLLAPILPRQTPKADVPPVTVTQPSQDAIPQTQPAIKDETVHAGSVPASDGKSTHPTEVHAEEPPHAPLLPHEVAPSSEQHAPLFPHEAALAQDQEHDGPASPTSPSARSPLTPTETPQTRGHYVPQEADLNNPFLIKFPTDREGILKHIEEAQNKSAGPPAIAVSTPRSDAENNPLPVVHEDEASDNPLPIVHEDEASDVQPPRADDAYASGALPEAPTDPITPPLTPKEREFAKKQEKIQEVLTAEAVELAVAEAAVEAEAKALDRQRKKEAREANFSAVTLAFGLILGVAAIAAGFWLANRSEAGGL